VSLAVACQYLFGRVWWCQCGQLNPFSGEIASQHNSQHLFDPYTFTHVLHGILFYALLWLILRRWFGIAERFVIAIGIEAFWEVIENTSIVIERYRETTISLGYYGDSILNSATDVIACASGYLLAMWLPAWVSALLFVGLETTLLWWIRDSLVLNIIMLISPSEAIKGWQQGGTGQMS
jgi:hypothetical protein